MTEVCSMIHCAKRLKLRQQQGNYQGYQQGGYQQPGSYQPRPGGYQPVPGGYQPGPGGYQPNPGGPQAGPGGYQPGPGGYQPGSGGFQPSPGGYQPRPTLETGHGPYPSIGGQGGVSPQVQQWFAAVDKDRSGFITATELKSALVNAQGQNFSDTACSLMIGMFDKDRSGHINIEEFDKLYTYINQWLAVFKTFDNDQSGHIDQPELTQALSQMGFRFSPDFITFLVNKSDPAEKKKVSVDQFIVLCIQIQRFTEAFRVRDSEQKGLITIGFEDFLNVALSCSI